MVGVCGKWVVSVLCACPRACSLSQRCDVLLCLSVCLCVLVTTFLLAYDTPWVERSSTDYSTLSTRPFTHPSTASHKCFVTSCVVVDVNVK